jgi:glyceraldehyde 3-phosphate dehydrogenase
MAIRVAINGFGRIGRCVLRAAWDDPSIEFVHINDLTPVATLAHLLEYDSVHGRSKMTVEVDGDFIVAGGKRIRVTAERDPAKLPWAAEKVDVVLECTGIFTKREQAALHLQAGARRVIISAPATGADATVVMGVNDQVLKAGDRIVSNASCTTNCLAPAAKVIHERFGIVAGLMTTVHSYTMDQNLLDAPHKSDLRRARAAALNMVPTSTGAAKAVGLVLPDLNGKLNGIAIRVPTPNVSLVDLTVTTEKPVTAADANAALTEASLGSLAGILAVTDKPVVSSDLVGNPASSTIDLALTQTMGTHMLKIVTWYDNEWGFSARMVDLAKRVAALEKE